MNVMYRASHKVCSVLETDSGKGRGKLNCTQDNFCIYVCVHLYVWNNSVRLGFY